MPKKMLPIVDRIGAIEKPTHPSDLPDGMYRHINRITNSVTILIINKTTKLSVPYIILQKGGFPAAYATLQGNWFLNWEPINDLQFEINVRECDISP